ncbi:MAG: hypothetical protein LLF28_00565 [Nitrospiraceae bacterium]|nr:hypothetical protein [Nitrospiraceae bacterium]
MEDLKKAAEEMKKAMEQMGIGLPKTPQEKVDIVIENTNRAYRDLMAGLSRIEPKEGLVIPVLMATRIKGYVIVSGKDYDPLRHGWRPFELEYKIREDFIGWMIITDYYDTKARRFTGKKTYMIGSVSTDIKVMSQKGKQCVETDHLLPPTCKEWQQITTHDIDKGDVYPAMHDWTILADSDEKKITIEVESPGIYFHSPDKQAGRSLGCFGTKIERTMEEFKKDMEAHKLSVAKKVGVVSGGTPRCDIGSEIELNMELCDPKNFADIDKCKQTELLLEDLKVILKIRDAFKDMAPGAKDVAHLLDLVGLEIKTAYPGMDIQNEEFLARYSASYNICTGETVIPDTCKECAPSPLCKWRKKGLEIHEQIHDSDIQNNPKIRQLFCDTQYQLENFPDVNFWERLLAKTYAKMDYDAYNEQAKYLRDIIQEQLSGNVDCTFKPEFFSEFQEAISKIDKNR